MFRVRNSCGIRRINTKRFNRCIESSNTYGTKRPSGGAFVSLDPGTGTDDTSVWILVKTKAYYTPTHATYDAGTGVMEITTPTTIYS